MSELWRRLTILFHRERFQRELEEEMELHQILQADENQRRGMDPNEARFAAQRQLGNTALLKERGWDVWGWGAIERLWQDLRYAFRTLCRTPVFAAATLLVLGLGIGGATTVFSLINALVLHPYPYPQPERLVEIQARGKAEGDGWRTTVRIRDFFEFREQSTVLGEIGAYGGWLKVNLTSQSVPGLAAAERIRCGEASAGFLRVLGVQPALGRYFTPSEDRPGGPPVVMLSYGMWKGRYGGRPDILGQTLDLGGRTHTIIGVMPRLRLPGEPAFDIWTPTAFDPAVGRDMRMDGDSLWPA